MFYIVSMYGLINLDALQSFMLLDENYVCTLVFCDDELLLIWSLNYLFMMFCNDF